jgi:hypothetical protein
MRERERDERERERERKRERERERERESCVRFRQAASINFQFSQCYDTALTEPHKRTAICLQTLCCREIQEEET